jgi:CelD/BcsL family acetyltransferase involved in cellulose biosynthesis
LRFAGRDTRGAPITHAQLDHLPKPLSTGRATAADRAAPPRWQPVDLTDRARLAPLVAQYRAIAARAGGAGLHSDLEWLLGRAPGRVDSLRVLMFRDGGASGYAAFLVRRRPLKFQLGEVTLFAPRLRHFTLSGEPVLADLDAAMRPRVMAELLSAARGLMASGDALALEGVPVGGALDQAIDDRAGPLFAVARLGAPFEHQLIEMPADWDGYERQLGTRSRKSLRYSRKKLIEHLEGGLEVRCFTDRADVDRFLEDARRVSQKTYQWNLLGLGLRDRDALGERLGFAAELGWLRCYVLYCRAVPTAFMVGMLHGDTYHYLDVGYDPDWAKWSVGSVLQVEVMHDLFGLAKPPRRFDFSTGYGAHKARFANRSQREANYLLLPRGVRSALLLACYRANEAMSAAAARLLERYDLKAKLKKLVRGRAAARAPGEQAPEVSP